MATSLVSPFSVPRQIADTIMGYTGTLPTDDHIDTLINLFLRRSIKYIPLPEELTLDPVSLTPFVINSCVITPCGHTYNHSTMVEQFSRGQNFCACCKAPITAASLRTTHDVSTLPHMHGSRLLRVFIEVRDSTAASPSSDEQLQAFNRELSSR